jgi:dolichol-phosphate mannosyltransferase
LEKLVIIPTYNEKENVENIIAAVIGLQQNFHILIIDDGLSEGVTKNLDNLNFELAIKVIRNDGR